MLYPIENKIDLNNLDEVEINVAQFLSLAAVHFDF
jgi:hypothetical protein